jgi:hypothetical protein
MHCTQPRHERSKRVFDCASPNSCRDADALGASQTPSKRPGCTLDEEARQVLLRLKGLGQRRQARQACSQDQVSTATLHNTTYFDNVLDPANTNRNDLADKGDIEREREARISTQAWPTHCAQRHLNGKVAAYHLRHWGYLKQAGIQSDARGPSGAPTWCTAD